MASNRTAREIYKRPDNHCQNDLTDAEWAIVELLIPRQGRTGRPRHTCNACQILNAIEYMLASRCQWRLIPFISACPLA